MWSPPGVYDAMEEIVDTLLEGVPREIDHKLSITFGKRRGPRKRGGGQLRGPGPIRHVARLALTSGSTKITLRTATVNRCAGSTTVPLCYSFPMC